MLCTDLRKNFETNCYRQRFVFISKIRKKKMLIALQLKYYLPAQKYENKRLGIIRKSF